MNTPAVSGFSIIRNAVLMGYPVKESILSALPLVQEFVLGVGQSEDGTEAFLQTEIKDPKLKMFPTIWDTTKTKGGLILSEKTNQSLAHTAYDWCLYLQGDEVLHEDDYPKIKAALARASLDPSIEGILFDYVHFYGSFHVVATNRKWYRREVRIVRKGSGIQSVKDAQGFQVKEKKPRVIHSGARIFHYGWVKPPKQMGTKSKFLSRWWHGNGLDAKFEDFRYDKQYGLRPFKGEHPAVMKDLIASQNWDFDHRRHLRDWKLKDLNLLASDLFESLFHYRIGEYKNYDLQE
ncbi:MAG: hypothetical protein K2X47_05735 [Bdellovibrionales bacterium]|nr:hypothetical protein [Bdellovibrionales bacterium]